MNKRTNNSIQDSDADGLLDIEEKKYGTDPLNRDTDHDDLGDYEEVKIYGTDPLDPDTDCDGLSDGQEVKMGRNPKGPGLLKDLFIPNECNNYKPKALHPKRLFFHALSLIAIKVVMIVFVLSFPITAWLTPDILTVQSQKIIQLTNNIRTSLNIHSLVENSVLKEAALVKAQDMLINQYFAHLSPENKGLSSFLVQSGYQYICAGENLALGFSEAEDVVDAWVKSPTHYANLVDPDFTDIGVGIVSGAYKGYDTTLIAQYFGATYNVAVVEEEVEEVVPVVEVEEVVPVVEEEIVTVVEEENVVLAEKEEEPLEITEEPLPVVEVEAEIIPVVEELDTIAPIIDHTKTSVSAYQPDGQNNLIVKAVAYLSEDTTNAQVNFNDYIISLTRDYTVDNKWIGNLVLYNEDGSNTLNPVVLASLEASDQVGNTIIEDIAWENITPNKTTSINQYLFLKNNPSEFVKPLFDVSTIYYHIILVLAIIALLLNIFIKIHKQHASVILSSLGFIVLLSLLTIL